MPLFADGPFQSVEFLVTVGLLIGTLLAGAVVIYCTDMWRNKRALPPEEGIEALSMYRDLYDEGELEDAEYRTIRDRIARKMKAGPAGAASGVNSAGAATPLPEAPPGTTPGPTPGPAGDAGPIS